jgi:hypothetical protein
MSRQVIGDREAAVGRWNPGGRQEPVAPAGVPRVPGQQDPCVRHVSTVVYRIPGAPGRFVTRAEHPLFRRPGA